MFGTSGLGDPEGLSVLEVVKDLRLAAASGSGGRKDDKDDKDDHKRDSDSDPRKDLDHDKDHDRDHDHHHEGDDDDDDDDDDDGGKHGGTNGGNNGGNCGTKGPTATPFLLIPASTGDTGARPIPAAQAVMNDSIQATIANPLNPNGWSQFQIQLSCLVGNLGVVGCAVGLAAFYIGDQFSVWNAGHESLAPAQVKANAQLVGYASFQVPPGGTATVVCSKLWVPGSSTAAQKGVLVQVYDLFTDHMTAPFDAVNDRHVARNDEVMDPLIF